LFFVGSFCSLFLGVFWAYGARVLWVLLGFCELALVAPVYLRAHYAFFNKVLLLIKKKREDPLHFPDILQQYSKSNSSWANPWWELFVSLKCASDNAGGACVDK
jgi:hypothetical protein